MKSCEKYIELISACIDGEISDADRSELEIHLEFCPECRKVAEAFAAISGNFPKEEPVPENFTSGTMAKIKAEGQKPTGIKKFISGYGKYTGLAAALVVVLLGAQVFTGNMSKETAADTAVYMNSTAMAPMAATDSARGEPEAAPGAAAPEAESYNAVNDSAYSAGITADTDMMESATEEDGFSESEAVAGGAGSDDSAPAPMPESTEVLAEPQFSVTVQVTDVNELYSKMGYTERFYSVSRLYEPAPEAFTELINSGDATQIFKSLDEVHYKVPMAQLNELDPEVFTEIVFDDLTAQYGLVILMTAEE